MNTPAKHFAVIRRWADNPNDFEVYDYTTTHEEATALIRGLPKPRNKEYRWEVGKYFAPTETEK